MPKPSIKSSSFGKVTKKKKIQFNRKLKNTPYDKVFKNENTFLARNTNGFYHLN